MWFKFRVRFFQRLSFDCSLSDFWFVVNRSRLCIIFSFINMLTQYSAILYTYFQNVANDRNSIIDIDKKWDGRAQVYSFIKIYIDWYTNIFKKFFYAEKKMSTKQFYIAKLTYTISQKMNVLTQFVWWISFSRQWVHRNA